MDQFDQVPSKKRLPASLVGTGMILDLVGNLGAASAAKRAADRNRIAAEIEAQQLAQQGGQAVAGSQREAITERRKAELLASRGLAVAAASGGGAADPTVTKLLADISGEGSYRAALALYAGEERKRQLDLAAAARRYEGGVMVQGGRSAAAVARIRALSGLVGGTATLYKGLYGKYGMGGPKGEDSSEGDDADVIDRTDIFAPRNSMF